MKMRGTAFHVPTKTYHDRIHTPDLAGPDWIVNPANAPALVTAGVPPKFWKANGGDVAEMTDAEKDAASLGAEKTAKVVSMKEAVGEYISSVYDPLQQIALLGLWVEGGTGNRNFPNRRAKAGQIMDWVNTVLSEFYAKKNAVVAASTRAGVAAVVLDLAQFDATKPPVTIEEVKNTNN